MALIRNPATGEIRVTDDPTAYLEQGWSVPSEAEALDEARRLEFSSFGEQAQAQAERVARGATLGAVQGFGTDDEAIRARAEVSREESPITSFAADVLPDVAVGLATGGLGGLATGAGRAAAASALRGGAGLARAGLAAGRAGGVAALAGESLGSGAVGAAQVAFEEGRQLGDDPGRDAENVLLWGGLNFGLGAATMARTALKGRKATRAAAEAVEELDDVAAAAEARALQSDPMPPAQTAQVDEIINGDDGATGGLADETIAAADETTPAVRETAEALDETLSPAARRQQEREAVDDGLERAVRKASHAEADDIVERVASGKAPEGEASSLGRQRRLYQNRQAILDVSTREVQRDLTKVVGDVRRIVGDGKVEHIAKRVGQNLPAQRAAAGSVAHQAAKFAGELKAEARAYGAEQGGKALRYPIKAQKDLTLALMEHAKAVQTARTGAETFEALNEFKRVADDFKVQLEAGSINSTNPIHHQRLIPKIEAFASSIRKELESSTTWGQAGEMQAAYNAVISDRLMPSMRIFEESVLERTHRGYDAVWQTEGWETKISALLKGADPGKRRHVNAVLEAMGELASVRGKYGDASAAKSIGERVDRIRRTLGLADEVKDATDRMSALGQLAGVVPLVGGLAREAVTGDIVAGFRKLAGATDAAVDRSVDDWIRSSRVRGGGKAGRLARIPEMSAETRQIAEVAKRHSVSHGMALFMGDDDSPVAAFERAREALMDDERFFESIGADYQSLQTQSPEMFMLVAGRASELRALLLERMPPNVAVSMANPRGYPPSRESIEDWSVYWNAAKHPMRVIKNVAAIRVQELEVLERCYPRLFDGLKQRTIERIGEAQASGEPLDDTLLMRLDLLFGLDGAGSIAFSKDVKRIVDEYNQAQAQAAQAGGAGGPGAPRPAGAPGSVQGVAATGATFGQGF